ELSSSLSCAALCFLCRIPLIRFTKPGVDTGLCGPAEILQRCVVQNFSRSAVGHVAVIFDLSAITYDSGYLFGELMDADLFAGSNIDIKQTASAKILGIDVFKQKYDRIRKIVRVHKFAFWLTAAPQFYRWRPRNFCLVKFSDQCRYHV